MVSKTEKINIFDDINNKKTVKKKEMSSDDEDDQKETKKNLGGRPKKSDKYKKEREEILRKLNEILGITEDNKKFYTWDLDNDEKIQEKIMELKDDVDKYFNSKHTTLYTNKDSDRTCLKIARIILKEMGFSLTRTTKNIDRDGKKVQSGCYLLNVE